MSYVKIKRVIFSPLIVEVGSTVLVQPSPTPNPPSTRMLPSPPTLHCLAPTEHVSGRGLTVIESRAGGSCHELGALGSQKKKCAQSQKIEHPMASFPQDRFGVFTLPPTRRLPTHISARGCCALLKHHISTHDSLKFADLFNYVGLTRAIWACRKDSQGFFSKSYVVSG